MNTNAETNAANIILKWLVFWILTFTGAILLACVILIPLAYENEKLILEYNLISNQLHLLKEANEIIKSQANAIGKDPQFTEDIVRKELNIRKPGIETIKVNPVPIKEQKNAKNSQIFSHLFILTHIDSWYIKPFIEFRTRLWIFAISIGLILTGIITSK